MKRGLPWVQEKQIRTHAVDDAPAISCRRVYGEFRVTGFGANTRALKVTGKQICLGRDGHHEIDPFAAYQRAGNISLPRANNLLFTVWLPQANLSLSATFIGLPGARG